ncbi:hypothetical protein [Paractinoplanes durhamensis]|uniref:Uncharacterized protein n=1 Tax=Paractinoplanes durhamensis TaxID=113563 RepID=A0ABQ3Z3Z3_9ACTN|nr:hypothetical protein [Actinoplanes durhamensis]GIE04537.1 hypothetical protein Adu01nite_58870 [Actinoplanes durhamensis]
MRRFLLVLSGIIAVLATAAAPATAATVSSAATVSAATACVSSAAATYRHSFDGAAGTTTITATRPLCAGQTETFSIASYTTGVNRGQFIYDSDRDTITASKRSVTLRVALPGCDTQVEAFFGSSVQTESTSTDALYGTAMLGAAAGAGARSQGTLAWYAGGTTRCVYWPTVTITNACDGTFTAQLSNSPRARTAAVFLTGSRRIRLTPGATTTIKVAKGGTLTVRDSSLTTTIASWRAPATDCLTTPAASPTIAAPLPTQPTATTAPTTAAPTTTSPTPSASASTYETAGPLASTNPAALAPATSSDVAAKGMSTTSIIAIALGLLMIATGAAAITWLIRMNRQTA